MGLNGYFETCRKTAALKRVLKVHVGWQFASKFRTLFQTVWRDVCHYVI